MFAACHAVGKLRDVPPDLISFCCGKSFVAFRSAKAARNLRYFRGAKGDNPADATFRNRN